MSTGAVIGIMAATYGTAFIAVLVMVAFAWRRVDIMLERALDRVQARSLEQYHALHPEPVAGPAAAPKLSGDPEWRVQYATSADGTGMFTVPVEPE